MIKLENLKIKNSVSVKFEGYRKTIETKGLVFQAKDELKIITLDGELVSIQNKNIIEINRTRFPKEISEILKKFYDYYCKKDQLETKLKAIEDNIRKHKNKKVKLVNEINKVNFNYYFDKKSAIKFLQNEIPSDLTRFRALKIGEVEDADISIQFWYNSENKKSYMCIDYTLEDRGYGYEEVEVVPDRHIVDDYCDFEGLAKKYAPKKKALIENIFKDGRFIKSVNESKSACSGDKAYIFITSSYSMQLNFNKNNFKEFHKLLTKNLKQLKKEVGKNY